MMFYNTSELNFRAISNRTSDPNAEFDKRNEHVLMCVSQCVCETEKTIRITESEGLREMKKREIKSLGVGALQPLGYMSLHPINVFN